MKTAMILLGAALALSACTGKQNNEENATGTKSLVVYYSQSGATATVAEAIAEQTGADLDSIVAVNPYNGSFDETIARCQEEMKNGTLPELKPQSKDFANYDTIYIGTPVWFGTMASPMAAYLKQSELAGKVVIPFVTYGSGGLETTVAAMKEAAPKANFLNKEIPAAENVENATPETIIGYGVRNARISKAAEEVGQWLVDIGVKQGKVSECVNFGESRALTADDKALWDKACGSYPMPLGEPANVKERKTSKGTEYCYTVNNKDAQGKATTAEIYVVKSDDQNAEPEFIRAVR